jgi:hypothetical protein
VSHPSRSPQRTTSEVAEKLNARRKKRQGTTSQLGEKVAAIEFCNKGTALAGPQTLHYQRRALAPAAFRDCGITFSPSCSVVPKKASITRGFRGCRKTQRKEQEASGHDFSRAEKATITRGFRGCGKTQRVEQEASGHDFKSCRKM